MDEGSIENSKMRLLREVQKAIVGRDGEKLQELLSLPEAPLVNPLMFKLAIMYGGVQIIRVLLKHEPARDFLYVPYGGLKAVLHGDNDQAWPSGVFGRLWESWNAGKVDFELPQPLPEDERLRAFEQIMNTSESSVNVWVSENTPRMTEDIKTSLQRDLEQQYRDWVNDLSDFVENAAPDALPDFARGGLEHQALDLMLAGRITEAQKLLPRLNRAVLEDILKSQRYEPLWAPFERVPYMTSTDTAKQAALLQEFVWLMQDYLKSSSSKIRRWLLRRLEPATIAYLLDHPIPSMPFAGRDLLDAGVRTTIDKIGFNLPSHKLLENLQMLLAYADPNDLDLGREWVAAVQHLPKKDIRWGGQAFIHSRKRKVGKKDIDSFLEALKQQFGEAVLEEFPDRNIEHPEDVWSFQPHIDGTCEITSYHGLDTDVTIPLVLNGLKVTVIGKRAFSPEAKDIPTWVAKCRRQLKHVVIPEGIISIGCGAFAGCRKLENVKLPESIRNIEKGAFAGCKSLQSMQIPKKAWLGKELFRGCLQLESVELPETLQEIPVGMFTRSGLQRIDLPENLVRIRKDAFADCVRLKSVKFPERLQRIDAYAFKWCKSLTQVTIREGVTEIGRGCFLGCHGLESISFPNSLHKIPASVCLGCNNLQHVKLPTRLRSIGLKAFDECRVEDIRFPDTTTSIGRYAFSRSKLTGTLHLPEALEVMGEGAFAYNQFLTKVEFPPSLTAIPRCCFEQSGLEGALEIPKSVKEIGAAAFKDCEKLTAVSLPDTPVEIRATAFNGCSDEFIKSLHEQIDSM